MVRKYSSNTVINAEDSSSTGHSLTRTFPSALTSSWVVDFDYDWMWGGSSNNNYCGMYSLYIDVSLLDANNNGYRIRTRQGTSNVATNSDKIVQIYKVTSGTATLLTAGQGPGYNQMGWKARSLSGPQLLHIRFSWDKTLGRLTAYRDLGAGPTTVASVVDTTYSSFTKIVIAGAYTNSEGPQIDNVSITSPGKFVWGVAGHPNRSSAPGYYTYVSAADQLNLVKELGCSYYRVDTSNETRFSQLLTSAAAQDIGLITTIHGSTNLGDPNNTPENIYTICYNRGLAFGQTYAGRLTHVELGNEYEHYCIKSTTTNGVTSYASGKNTTDYDDAGYARCLAALKGLSDGVHAGDPSMKRIINTAGWYHYGFLDRLIADGVNFEVIGWHWYSDAGSLSRVMQKLASYGRPIWVTEFDRKNGSMQSTSVLSDNFDADTLYDVPAGWTTSDAWWVSPYGSAICAVEASTSADTGRSLTQTFTSAITDSWVAKFDFDWKYGGTASPANGNYALVIDMDLLNNSNNGYRVRVHQGTSNVTTNSSQLIQIYKVTGGTATLITNGQGAGYNKPGWVVLGQAEPTFQSVRLRRNVTTGTIDACYLVDGAWTTAAKVTDTTYTSCTKLVITTRGYNNREVPQIDNVAFTTYGQNEADQADKVATIASELWNLPGIEAVFLYELLDDCQYTVDNSEAYYGICTINGTSFGARKAAFSAYQSKIAELGTIPSAGDIIVDNAYLKPSVELSDSSAWTASSVLSGFFYKDYLTDNGTNKNQNYVRFYPCVPSTGTYSISIKFPPQTANSASVPVQVRTPGGTSTVMVNQQSNDGGWVNLGSFALNAWQPGSPVSSTSWINATDACWIEIDNNGTTGAVTADAIRLNKK